jgi:hypothetical protein
LLSLLFLSIVIVILTSYRNNGAAHLPEELKGRFKDRIEKNGGEVAFFGDGECVFLVDT